MRNNNLRSKASAKFRKVWGQIIFRKVKKALSALKVKTPAGNIGVRVLSKGFKFNTRGVGGAIQLRYDEKEPRQKAYRALPGQPSKGNNGRKWLSYARHYSPITKNNTFLDSIYNQLQIERSPKTKAFLEKKRVINNGKTIWPYSKTAKPLRTFLEVATKKNDKNSVMQYNITSAATDFIQEKGGAFIRAALAEAREQVGEELAQAAMPYI